MNVIWTAKAFKALDAIFDSIAEKSVTSAHKTVNAILDRENQLITQPKSGTIENRLKLKREYRFLVEGHYKIIYRIGAKSIYVVKVFDTRQNPKKINK